MQKIISHDSENDTLGQRTSLQVTENSCIYPPLRKNSPKYIRGVAKHPNTAFYQYSFYQLLSLTKEYLMLLE